MVNKRQRALLSVGSDRSPARAREDYVKAIYQLGRGEPVKAAALARYLKVSRVSVSKAKRALEKDGLLERGAAPSSPLHLTRRGCALAIAMVRRHRVLETFLHRSLGLPLERLHAEAERIEHVISDDVALRIAKLLGKPAFDPHGHPIPYGEQAPAAKPLRCLTDLAVGTRGRVVSLDDRDDAGVAALAAAGVLPGCALRIEDVQRDRLLVRKGNRTIPLPRRYAALVRIAN
jgi:DtxR family Mn-dependent transcriptional regulator